MLALIPLFPLLGFLINGCWYAFFQTKKGADPVGSAAPGAIAAAAIFSSFCVSVLVFLDLHGRPAEARVIEQLLFSWIHVTDFSLDMTLRVDVLSSLFLLVITGIGTLIHVYSIGYMSHDETPTKFFAYLNLFCFAMLILVMGGSLPVLFFGWEGVGLCSYLLIGYWYTDVQKAAAGKKAFIVNRIGDLGFLLGMFLIFTKFGTLDFVALKGAVAALSQSLDPMVFTAIGILLFVGCMGKSAQLPLFVWLPDAMAGPTPVSALIHAATMVTSGIYLVARLNFMYALSPSALSFIAIIGAFTAFFAATIAIAQTDIKKVLAYSTVSQLGYMFLACGVGAYGAGVFHVITHAFFKALLFLGAGSVIHGMHEEQDILKMGGLRTRMPVTFAVFLLGWLAICGVPPFSGFFSKDEILWKAFSAPHGSVILWGLGAVTAVMTAFYMTRMFSLTFFGKPRFDEKHVHVHESPLLMTIPLGVLAFLSVVGGFIGIPHMSWLDHWLEPVIPSSHEMVAGLSPSLEWVLMGVSVLGAVGGIVFALGLYKDLSKPAALKAKWPGLHKCLDSKWFVDEIYDAMIVKPIYGLSVFLWKFVDVAIIDRVVLTFGRASEWTGQTLRILQTGSIQAYAFMLLTGLVATVGYLIYGLA